MLEPRFFPRAALDFAVVLDIGSGPPCEGRLVNLSEGGALAELSRSVQPGISARVKIEIPGRTNWFAARGVVVRCDASGGRAGDYGVAVRWADLSEDAAEIISEVVARTDAIAWSDRGSQIPRDVAVRFVPVIRRIARGIASRLPPHVSVDDLIGGGFVAFVDFYGKNRHLPAPEFERAVKTRIRGAMLDELRGSDPLTRRMRHRERAIATGRKDLEAHLKRSATHAEVAAHLNLTIDAYTRTVCASRASHTTGLDEAESDVADESFVGPEKAMQETESMNVLRTALNALPPRLRKVLELHYGEELTLRAIGNILGVTEARISQLHSEAVRRIRETCNSVPPPPASGPRSHRRPKESAPAVEARRAS